MNKVRQTMLSMLLAAVLLSSCAPAVPASPTPDVNAILTQSVETFVFQFFQTQTAIAPTATVTPTVTPPATFTSLAPPSPIATATVQQIFTPVLVYPTVTATGTRLTPTTNPATSAVGCNNLALIRDETIPSGTVFAPGESFTKTWKVANNGTCEWTMAYKLVFVSGEAMEGETTRPRNPIAAGKWTQLDVRLTAPSKPGTYTGYWQLSDDKGKRFGALLGVSIVVKKPAPTSYP